MLELLERLLDRSHGERTRIDQLRRAVAVCGHHARSVRHFAVCKRRAIFHHQHAFSLNQRRDLRPITVHAVSITCALGLCCRNIPPDQLDDSPG